MLYSKTAPDKQAQLTWVMESIAGGLIIIDKSEVITLFNCAVFKELGCTPDNMLGKHISGFYKRLGIPLENSPLLEALHRGTKLRCMSHILSRYFEEVTQPLYNEQGEIQGAAGLYIDVTEQVGQQQELQRLKGIQKVGEMAAHLAHEIRNPLAVVRGHLQFLQSTQKGPHVCQQYELMIEQLDRVNSMLQDFLNLARGRLRKATMNSLTAIVDRVRPLLESEARLAGLNLEVELEDTPLFLMCPDDIQRLLLNLYRNAVEATAAGGSILVQVGLTENREPYLAVTDTGCGMTPAIMAKVGTPFLTTKPNGTGLGLAQCKRIAQSYGAQLSIKSQPQQGTVVKIRFPAHGPPPLTPLSG